MPWKTKQPMRDYSNEVRVAESFDADFSVNSKKDSMNLDCHLEASVMAGLIEDYKGASNFINDRPDPGQVTCTFVWTAKSLEEYYQDFQNCDFRLVLPGLKEKKLEATHLVVSVIYGAQAYCVFSLDLNDKQEHEDIRKEARHSLLNLTKKFWAAIDSKLNVADFKEEFDKKERHQLTRVKCRLYSDLQVEPFRHCNVFDAYEHILKLQKLIFKIDSHDQAVPVAIKICPLKVLTRPVGKSSLSRLLSLSVSGDVENELVQFCCRTLADLKRIAIKTEKFSNNIQQYTEVCSALREFASTVSQYQNVIKRAFKEPLIAARRSIFQGQEFRRIATQSHNHPLFKLSKLEKWLSCKQAEIDMAELLASKTGTTSITFLATRNQLQHLSTNKNNALVLVIPSLDEKTNLILDAMKKCCNKLNAGYREIKDDTQPWHTIQSKRKFVLDHIREMAVHAEKNHHVLSQVHFFVVFEESGKPFDCTYSIYKAGILLKDSVRRLPDPPSGLRIHPVTRKVKQTKKSFIRAEWDYEELGYPCQFLVEYRSKGTSDPWIQQRTTEPNETTLMFTFVTDSTLEFRVAAETCIGRSEFSDVVDTFISPPGDGDVTKKKLKEDEVLLQPPTNLKVKSVIGTAVELEWTPSPRVGYLSYLIVYWKKGEKESSTQETGFGCHDCWLEDLEPETTYQFHVLTSSFYESKAMSQPSGIYEFTTTEEIKLDETLINQCKKTGNANGLDLYQLPLSNESENLTFAEYWFDAFKDTGLPLSNSSDNVTILLVGESDSGKTSLINSFVNFVFGVVLEDPFRFQLVEPSQVDSRIRIYKIQHASQFSIDYSLTIIDTPSYSEDNDPAQNREITETIRKFIDNRDGDCIQGVDLVGFVVDSSASCLTPLQLYIYFSLISIFGNGVKRNINFLLTSAEKEDPSLWNDIVDSGLVTYGPHQLMQLQHKFNSSIYFCSNTDSSECFWEWRENFENFFSSLRSDHKCVSLLKQLVDEKKRLKTVVKELVYLLKVRILKLEKLMSLKGGLSDDISTVSTVVKDEVELPLGDCVTNCTKCQVTCHSVCGVNQKKADCEVMDHSMPENVRTCRVCLGKCSWKVHANQPFKWEFSSEKTSSVVVKKKYETELNKTLTSEELLDVLEEEMQFVTS